MRTARKFEIVPLSEVGLELDLEEPVDAIPPVRTDVPGETQHLRVPDLLPAGKAAAAPPVSDDGEFEEWFHAVDEHARVAEAASTAAANASVLAGQAKLDAQEAAGAAGQAKLDAQEAAGSAQESCNEAARFASTAGNASKHASFWARVAAFAASIAVLATAFSGYLLWRGTAQVELAETARQGAEVAEIVAAESADRAEDAAMLSVAVAAESEESVETLRAFAKDMQEQGAAASETALQYLEQVKRVRWEFHHSKRKALTEMAAKLDEFKAAFEQGRQEARSRIANDQAEE